MAGSGKCRVCGEREGGTLRTKEATYHRCRRCGTLQKELSEAEYRALNPGYDPGTYLTGRTEPEIRAVLGVADARTTLAEACRNLGIDPKGAEFLDIGCGMGLYLLAARDLGMTVLGFEPSANHGRVAQDVLGLPVVPECFDSGKVGDRRFDLVLLSHVIEHIYDPVAFTRDIAAVLKPGGALLMITPNADSLIARLTGPLWPMLVPVDHVTLIGPKAVGYLAPAGFRAEARTIEYPHEFAATLASVARTKLRGPRSNADGVVPVGSGAELRDPGGFGRLLKGALRVASWPAHLAATLTQRKAALALSFQKPG